MTEPLCPAWLSFTLTNVLRRLAHDPVAILGPFLKEGDTAVDVGSGPGFFSVPMARMVGERGLVVAVDIQPKMLEKTRRRAERAGVAGRIRLHLATANGLGLDVKADFALAFWMAHEVDDLGRFFAEIRAALKPGGSLLLVEPRGHVTERRFAEIVAGALSAGLEHQGTEAVRLSRAIVLRPARSRSQGEKGTGS
jgi:ubiquinone/menaquinone biosynthesis C-methylase UbiE